MKERLTLSDNSLTIATKLSEGNPGALTVVIRTFNEAEDIDPTSAFGSYGPALLLDSFNIYGSDIWILFKDVCHEDMASLIGLLRAVQLGITTRTELYRAITLNDMTDDRRNEILEAVYQILPEFNFRLAKAE